MADEGHGDKKSSILRVIFLLLQFEKNCLEIIIIISKMRSILTFLFLLTIAALLPWPALSQRQSDTLALHFSFNRYDLRPKEAASLGRFMEAQTSMADTLY